MSKKDINKRVRLRRRRAKQRAAAQPKPLPMAAIGIIGRLAEPISKRAFAEALADLQKL
jgi:hypothetical protein